MDEEWFAARGLFNRGLNSTGCLVTIDLYEKHCLVQICLTSFSWTPGMIFILCVYVCAHWRTQSPKQLLK